MPHPRITVRVSSAPTGDYGVLTIADDDGSASLMLPDAATVAFFERIAPKITILAGLEAYDRSVREFDRRQIAAADAIAMTAAEINQLAEQVEAQRKRLEARHG